MAWLVLCMCWILVSWKSVNFLQLEDLSQDPLRPTLNLSPDEALIAIGYRRNNGSAQLMNGDATPLPPCEVSKTNERACSIG